MKFFWLVSLLFSFTFGVDFQIITGAYSAEKSAINEEKKLQRVMDKEKEFFEKNGIHTRYKERKNYYLVTLEPFKDEQTLSTALKIIQKKYKGAYSYILPQEALPLTPDAPAPQPNVEPQAVSETFIAPTHNIKETLAQIELQEEANTTQETESNLTEEANTTEINATQVTTAQSDTNAEPIESITPEIAPEQTQQITPKEEKSMFDTWTLASAFLAFSMLAFIVLLLRKSQNKKEEEPLSDLPQTTKPLQEIRVEKVAMNELHGTEEGDFTLPSDINSSKSLPLQLQKRKLALHGKITKQNFKEFFGARILVAEDNLINQKVISGLLAESGIEVLIANNGKEALDILQNDVNFTLIIMDAHMPIMDGIEATKAIRENADYNHIPIVALSGDTSDSDIKKMLSAGMDEHLEKPLRIDALYDIFYIYTDYSQEENQQHFTSNELNFEKGLETCAGDESFYHEILDEFVIDYSDSDAKIFEYLSENQLILADKYLLDLLGITAHIGADNLSNVIREIKEALKDTDEKSYLTLAHQYSEHLHRLIESIKAYR
ncbi:MAG: response regulator [Sulfurimonas sp.]|nr:response regulator [Sulfurimonas sp.]